MCEQTKLVPFTSLLQEIFENVLELTQKILNYRLKFDCFSFARVGSHGDFSNFAQKLLLTTCN